MQTIALLLPLLLLVTPGIAHATNEGSYKFGLSVGFSDYNHCSDNDALDCSPPDNDTPLRVCVNHEVTNSTACIDGYIQGWQHWCKSDLKNCGQFTRSARPPTAPDLSKGKCPPSNYLDQSLGIYTCRSIHRAQELHPNVKLLNNQWQRAW